MQHEPRSNTQPFQRSRTTPFGDAFVSSASLPNPNVTRPLRAPTGPLKDAVSTKLVEVKKELDYVRHLTTLFAPSIAILRFAVHLTTLPELPAMEAFDQPETEPMFASPEASDDPDPFADLGVPQKKFALDIAGVLVKDPRVKQRAQVALYQYEEVVRAYDEGMQVIDGIASCSLEEAWERLQEMGIERTKGKAYAVCGFWDNFKNDPVICKLFPPPTPQTVTRGTQPLNPSVASAAASGSGQLRKPADPPPTKPSSEPSGLLGKLKGFFK